jgi:ABC-type transport system involved in multi-copper enzyme maturation permease subunit
MVKKIMKFELLSNLKNPFTYLFFVMLLGQGIWYTLGSNNYFNNDNMFMNAPAIMYQNLAGMGILLLIVTAVISAAALTRDLESGTAAIVYPSVINEKRFFIGKIAGALGVNLLVALAYPLGMLLFPYVGFGSPDQFGPVPLGQIAQGFAVLVVPNIILLITLSTFLVVLFRKTAVAYVGVLFLLMLFAILATLRENTSFPLLTELMDPFGYCSVLNMIDNMGLVERNTGYLPVNRLFLMNRLLWLSVSALMFMVAFLKFNFKYFITPPSGGKRVSEKENETSSIAETRLGPVLSVFSSASFLGKSFRLGWMDFKNMTRSVGFRMVLISLFFTFLGFNLLWTEEYYITTSPLPLTSVMTFARLPMMVMILVIMIIFAGEMLFKDRNSGVWQITDAMPTPSWVFVLSRFIALAGGAFVISALLLLTGVVTQFSEGFTDIEWGLYVRDLFMARQGWLTSLQIICMAFFCGSFFSSRLKGHIVSIGIFLFFAISLDSGAIEQYRFTFPFVPGMHKYSEMNGYGVFDTALPCYAGAWCSLAVLFFLLAVLFWNRGVDRTWGERWHQVRHRLNPVNGSVLVAFCLLFAGFQYAIYDNVVAKAGFQTSNLKEAEAAEYERKYIKYADTVQPKITDLDLKLDLQPAERNAVWEGRLLLANKSRHPIDTLHIDRKQHLILHTLKSETCELKMIDRDDRLRHSIYRLSPPLAPGESMDLAVTGTLSYKGFHQTDPQADLTFNGTILGTDLLPFFGYNGARALDNNKKRLKQGLGVIHSRMEGAENQFSRSNLFQSGQADSLTWNIVASTSAGQEVIAPGERVRSWKENGRNYFYYRSEKTGLLNFKLISARLDKKEFYSGNTLVSLYHSPGHAYNIPIFQKAVEQTMAWLSETIGPYPYSSLSITEKTFYDDDFVTFNNVTAISENHGWTADVGKPEDMEYIYYVVAKELAKQWIEDKVNTANVQGAEVLTQSLPEYYALSFMEANFGHGHAVKWLEERQKKYEKGKGDEAIDEKVVLQVDKASYVSRDKGGLALYALSRRTGPDNFNGWLKKWLEGCSRKNGFITAMDFFNDLKSNIPGALHPFAEEWFEERTQYRIALIDATMTDDKITLEISASRGVLDRMGNLTEQPVASVLEVGFPDGKGGVMEIQKIRMKSGTHTYTLNSAFKPETVILDPYYWYLIKNRKRTSKPLSSASV